MPAPDQRAASRQDARVGTDVARGRTKGVAMAVLVLVGVVLGNFVYQAFNEKDWGTAVERSWFQVVAVVLVLAAI